MIDPPGGGVTPAILEFARERITAQFVESTAQSYHSPSDDEVAPPTSSCLLARALYANSIEGPRRQRRKKCACG